MADALTFLITDQGWLAPLWYVGAFLFAAVVPVVPTPLIAALGGSAFGFVPAVLYGVVGLGLGALLSLTLARRFGLPLLRRLLPRRDHAAWEDLLGVNSLWFWGATFLVLNLDLAVMASGLSGVPLRHLWWTAMGTRLPWLLGSAWFGRTVLVSDVTLVLFALLAVPFLIAVGRLTPPVQRWLRRVTRNG